MVTVGVEGGIAEVLFLDECLVDVIEDACKEMREVEDEEEQHSNMIEHSQHLIYVNLFVDIFHQTLHLHQPQHIHQMDVLRHLVRHQETYQKQYSYEGGQTVPIVTQVVLQVEQDGTKPAHLLGNRNWHFRSQYKLEN